MGSDPLSGTVRDCARGDGERASLLAPGLPIRQSAGMNRISSDHQTASPPVAPGTPAAPTRAERKATRAERLAAALKSNLLRRKAQARARAQEAAATAEDEQAGQDEPAVPAASHNCAGIVDDKLRR